MVNHKINWGQGVNLFRISAQMGHGIAHGGQIDHGWNAGKVLHQDPGRAERDLVLDRALIDQPGGNGAQVGLADGLAILIAQQVFQQNLHRHGQARNSVQAGGFCGGQAVIGIGLVAHDQVAASVQTVMRRHGDRSSG